MFLGFVQLGYMNNYHWFLLVVSKYLPFLHPTGDDIIWPPCFRVFYPRPGDHPLRWLNCAVCAEARSHFCRADDWFLGVPGWFFAEPRASGPNEQWADSSWWFLWGWTGWTTMQLCFREILGGWISRQDWEQLLTLIVLCNLKRFQG